MSLCFNFIYLCSRNMEENIITSVQNARIKHVVALQQKSSLRREEGLFVVEGQREIEHCLEGGYEVVEVFSRKEEGVRSQESGVRSQESGVRRQESGVRSQDNTWLVQLNGDLVSPSEIPARISTIRSKLSPENAERLTVSFRADRHAPMGLVSDVKQALQQAYALKINYSATEISP